MKKILVVDDNLELCKILCRILQKKGYAVVVAFDGAEALEKFQTEDFDLLLTDLKMPRLSGMKLAERVREKSQETVIIIMTAFGNNQNKREAEELKVNEFLNKPFALPELIDTIEKNLHEN